MPRSQAWRLLCPGSPAYRAVLLDAGWQAPLAHTWHSSSLPPESCRSLTLTHFSKTLRRWVSCSLRPSRPLLTHCNLVLLAERGQNCLLWNTPVGFPSLSTAEIQSQGCGLILSCVGTGPGPSFFSAPRFKALRELSAWPSWKIHTVGRQRWISGRPLGGAPSLEEDSGCFLEKLGGEHPAPSRKAGGGAFLKEEGKVPT